MGDGRVVVGDGRVVVSRKSSGSTSRLAMAILGRSELASIIGQGRRVADVQGLGEARRKTKNERCRRVGAIDLMRVGGACLSVALEHLNGGRGWGKVEYRDGCLGIETLDQLSRALRCSSYERVTISVDEAPCWRPHRFSLRLSRLAVVK